MSLGGCFDENEYNIKWRCFGTSKRTSRKINKYSIASKHLTDTKHSTVIESQYLCIFNWKVSFNKQLIIE